MHKRPVMKLRIFTFYSVLIMVVVLIVTWVGFFYLSNEFEAKVQDNLNSSINSILQQFDLYIKEMSRATIVAMANRDVVNSLNDLYQTKIIEMSDMEYFRYAEDVNQFLFNVKIPDNSLFRINIFTEHGLFFTSDQMLNWRMAQKTQIAEREMVKRAKQKNGWIYVSGPFIDNFHQTESVWNTRLISIVRLFRSPIKTFGYIEVQKKYDLIEEMIQREIVPGRHFVLINEDSILIYPYGIESNSVEHAMVDQYRNDGLPARQPVQWQFTFNGKAYRAAFLRSEYSGVTMFCCELVDASLEPLKSMRNTIFFLSGVVFGISMLLIYIFANYIYTPLVRLRQKADGIHYLAAQNKWERPPEYYNFSNADSAIFSLNQSLDSMIERLNRSIDESIDMKVKMYNVYYKSLQSQVNPHFLHNALSMISVLGKETGDLRIPNICSSLEKLLKYSANLDKTVISLREERDNVENYLAILKPMYEHRLEYSVSISDELLDIEVPKMSLQPLVENSIKYGFIRKQGPLYIAIEGKTIGNNGWQLVVKDNGSGFDPERLNIIRQRLDIYGRDIIKAYTQKTDEFTGIGLVNTYMRFKMLYEDALSFDILEGDGCTIVIKKECEPIE